MVVNSMSYATYDSYKESGVDWLGEIPSDWELGRISAFFSERRQKVSDKDYPALSVTKLGVFPQWENVAKSNDGDNRKLVKKGDFVINSRSDRKGSSGIAKQDGSVSLINIVLKPVNIEPRYSEYLFKSYNFIEEFYRVGHGIVADLWTTRFDDIKNSMIALPTFDEQTKIANFLDQKTAQIDQAIALKQQQIEKLGEYKQIVIQNAVTKGLNPNAPMKDSGVEWIGNIPEHWDVKKNTHLFNKIGSGTTPTSSDLSYYDSGDINWLQTGDLNNDYIVATSRKINQKAMSKFSSLKLYDENSLVIAMYGATIGKVGLLKIKSTTNQACCVLGNSDKVFMKYIFYVMQFAKNHLISNSYGGGQPNINQDMIKNLRIPYPNLQEQEKIANYLDDLNEKIYKTSKGYQTQIDRLKEYKNILINQAVTGKIKI